MATMVLNLLWILIMAPLFIMLFAIIAVATNGVESEGCKLKGKRCYRSSECCPFWSKGTIWRSKGWHRECNRGIGKFYRWYFCI